MDANLTRAEIALNKAFCLMQSQADEMEAKGIPTMDGEDINFLKKFKIPNSYNPDLLSLRNYLRKPIPATELQENIDEARRKGFQGVAIPDNSVYDPDIIFKKNKMFRGETEMVSWDEDGIIMYSTRYFFEEENALLERIMNFQNLWGCISNVVKQGIL